MADSKPQKALEKAAESGDAQAMYDLGLVLEDQDDFRGSAKWMARASGLGMAKASFHVARYLHEHGRENLAESWFEKAIEQGSKEARAYDRSQLFDEEGAPRSNDTSNVGYEAKSWFQGFRFVRYVEGGDEKLLAATSPTLLWTHYGDGLNGEFVTNGFFPDYGEVHGYFEMEKPWSISENSSYIQVLEFTQGCETCRDEPAPDGSICEMCNGGQIDYLEDFFE
jgi:hypothetical protein